jgi:glucoamylase
MMLPEQLWDGEEMPQRGLQPGAGTGSAAPLGWAHAEYLKLLAAVAWANIPDQVAPARRRYVEGRPLEPAFVWSAAHRIEQFLAGRRVKVQLERRGSVRWSADEWETHRQLEARDTTLGLWAAELPTEIMRPGATMEWTAHYEDGGWEGVNHRLTCEGETG